MKNTKKVKMADFVKGEPVYVDLEANAHYGKSPEGESSVLRMHGNMTLVNKLGLKHWEAPLTDIDLICDGQAMFLYNFEKNNADNIQLLIDFTLIEHVPEMGLLRDGEKLNVYRIKIEDTEFICWEQGEGITGASCKKELTGKISFRYTP